MNAPMHCSVLPVKFWFECPLWNPSRALDRPEGRQGTGPGPVSTCFCSVNLRRLVSLLMVLLIIAIKPAYTLFSNLKFTYQARNEDFFFLERWLTFDKTSLILLFYEKRDF